MNIFEIDYIKILTETLCTIRLSMNHSTVTRTKVKKGVGKHNNTVKREVKPIQIECGS